MPVAIDDADAAELLERFDGLLLMGGGDLHPDEYGQERRDEIYGVIPHRDRFELALARTAVDRGVPTLAICRGHQVLNVAFGRLARPAHHRPPRGPPPREARCPGRVDRARHRDRARIPAGVRDGRDARLVLVAPPSGGRAHGRRAESHRPRRRRCDRGHRARRRRMDRRGAMAPRGHRRRRPGSATALRHVRSSGRGDHAVNRRRVSLTGERPDELFGVVERGDAPRVNRRTGTGRTRAR